MSAMSPGTARAGRLPGDDDPGHRQWRGRDWVSAAAHDLVDPNVASRAPWGVIDHVARARIGEQLGWGVFELCAIGKHTPSGFTHFGSVAA